MIRQFGKTPGQAVGQLFSWFDALAKNPDEAFPALIKSYKYNPDQMLAKVWLCKKAAATAATTEWASTKWTGTARTATTAGW